MKKMCKLFLPQWNTLSYKYFAHAIYTSGLFSFAACELKMRRGGSSGGGQSSLGYLFGGGEAPRPAGETAPSAEKAAPPPPPVDNSNKIPAGIPGNQTNNYYRADGQNTGNFITV